jgi:hypothetical protein
MQSNHTNTFRTKHDGISSKLIAKQWGVTLYMDTPGSNTKMLTKNYHKYGYYANTSQFGPFGNAK